MITTHTFFDKCNTILYNSDVNTGLSPIMELYYGNLVSRILIHFDVNHIKKLINDKTYPDVNKLKHTLKLFNVAKIVNKDRLNQSFSDSTYCGIKDRAVSFDLILFKVNKNWDNGRGYDFSYMSTPSHKPAYSTSGSNWFHATTDTLWDNEGIYTNEQLTSYYDEFISGTTSVNNPIIATKHFDFGNEPINFDITKVVNDFISGEENYGLCVAFAPKYEISKYENSQYVGVYSKYTHTFFEPYVETTYDDYIQDDRSNFFVGKDNKLYFYCNINGTTTNLDEIPTASINDKVYQVTQATKGVYYITIPYGENFLPNTMYFDTWDIVYNGIRKKIELYFTPKENDIYFGFGLPDSTDFIPKFMPVLYGIKDNENIKQGDVRKINVECKINYTSQQLHSVSNLMFRIYTIQEEKEIDVYSWNNVNIGYNCNYFYIKTDELIPSNYHIDIKAFYNQEEIITYDALKFNIVKNATNDKI